MQQTVNRLRRLWIDLKNLQTRNKVLIVALLGLLVAIGFAMGRSTPVGDIDTDVAVYPRSIRLSEVQDLSRSIEPIRLLGRVSSREEARIRAEAQGRIVSVLVRAGDRVSQGQVLANIENATQQAQVAQAQASLQSAQATVSKNQNLSGVNLVQAERSLQEARTNGLNTLKTSLTQAEDAVFGQADTLFNNADTADPRLLFRISSNQSLGERIEKERVSVGRTLAEWDLSVSKLDASRVGVAQIDEVEDFADTVRAYLSLLVEATNSLQTNENQSANQIQSWKSSASSARLALGSVISALGSIRNSLIQLETSVERAQEEQNQSDTEGLTTSSASLAQAEANLRSAELALAKTIIRAPISGVVSVLDIEPGDFVSVLEPVATVINNRSLEVVTFVTESDRDSISVGARAYLGENRIPGEVTQIAPVISQSTQKIEVKIRPSSIESFIDGQSVPVLVERSNTTPEDFRIPLTALKVLPAGFAVLTVVDGSVVGIPVEVGPILGDKVLVYEGVSMDTSIVVDVRGLAVGDEVSIEMIEN